MLPPWAFPDRVHSEARTAANRIPLLLLFSASGVPEYQAKRTIPRPSDRSHEHSPRSKAGASSGLRTHRNLRELSARAKRLLFQHRGNRGRRAKGESGALLGIFGLREDRTAG